VRQLTILTIIMAIVLVGTEQPLGDLELGGFPVGYYWTFILISIAFLMRKELKHDRRR